MTFCTDQCLLLPRLMLKQLIYRDKNKHSDDSYSLMPMPLLHQWHYSTSIGTFFPTGNCSIQGSLLGKITDASSPHHLWKLPCREEATGSAPVWFFSAVMSTSICSHHLVPVVNYAGPNEIVSQRLIYLNTCSPLGGTVCGVEGNLGDGALLEEVVTRG